MLANVRLRSFCLAKASLKPCVSWNNKFSFSHQYKRNVENIRYCNHLDCFGNILLRYTSQIATSYVEEGYAFEKTTKEALSNHGFVLSHRGGPNDAGLDFEGFWKVQNSQDQRIPVVVQCKRKRKRIGVAHIREFEGSMVNYCKIRPPTCPIGDGDCAILGVFVSSSGFTPQSQRQCQNSTLPLMLVDLNGEKVEDVLFSRTVKVMIPNLIVTKQRTLEKKRNVLILYNEKIIMSFEPRSQSDV